MNLQNLVDKNQILNLDSIDYDSLAKIDITAITDDSRAVAPGTLFVCIKGLTVDGHKYAKKAVDLGAVAVLALNEIEELSACDLPVIIVDNTERAMNLALNKFFDGPMQKMNIIGVTGTDGKTTTSEMMYQILNSLEKKTGYIGTNGIRSAHYSQENDYTTPLQGELFKAFKGFMDDSCEYVSMEATGERLGTGKMDGVTFDASIFTNLTRDALDLFHTMENYGAAKAKLMEYTKKDGVCVINADDPYADIFLKKANGKVITYGIKKPADVYADNISIEYSHLEFDMHGIFGDHHIVCGLSGIFNVYNIMAVIACLNSFGFSADALIEEVANLKPIEARQDVIDFGQPFKVIVDYAHTANAVKNLVEYIKSTLTDGYLRVVVGAGGSRDIHRRTDMAEYCTKTADYNYFTIEDARFEDPEMLVTTMVSTVPEATNYELIVDRDEAISKAIHDAKPGDAVLILGKGAESYMMTNGKPVYRPNDIERAGMVLEELGYAKPN